MTTSPNMNLPVPVVSTTPGPDWATNVVASLSIIDSHTHTTGQGVPITPDALNINASLPMQNQYLTATGAVAFTAQSAPLSSSLVGYLYESGVDLYYNDGAGNQVRITQSGSVTGASGTITGLPSGTASASYSAGTFSFQSATNTPATINAGPYVFGQAVASGYGVTVSASGSQTSNYGLTLPAAAPTANQILVSDGSGNFTWTRGVLPLGSVIATFPNLTGAYTTSATTTADSNGFVKCNGQTISDATSPMNGQVVPNINNSVFIQGSTTAGSSGGASSVTLVTNNLPSHTHTFTSTTSVATSSHTHNFSHNHEWGFVEHISANIYQQFGLSASDASKISITGADTQVTQQLGGGTGSDVSINYTDVGVNRTYYTSGVLSASSGSGTSANTASPSGSTTVSGTTNQTGSGTSFSIVPTYISAVYLMRVK